MSTRTEGVGPAPGTLLAGRYLVGDLLRRECFGSFFRATDTQTGEPVAAKIYLAAPEREGGKEDRGDLRRAWLQREMSVLTRLDSRHVPRPLRGAEDLEHGPVLVCEPIEGESLLERLKSRGPLPFEELRPWLDLLWIGLGDLHRFGVVHRCIKPSNLVLERSRSGATCTRIFDFGLCKLATDAEDTVARGDFGRALGLFSFMPPEQIGKRKTVDHRADIYACGTVIFQALSGQLPHYASNVLAMVEAKSRTEARCLSEVVDSRVHPRLDAFLARALERDPGRRFQTAEDALAAFREIPR